MISLDAYKAAAQENAEFLACLGITPLGGHAVPRRPRPSVAPGDGLSLPRGHLEELQRRIAALQQAESSRRSVDPSCEAAKGQGFSVPWPAPSTS